MGLFGFLFDSVSLDFVRWVTLGESRMARMVAEPLNRVEEIWLGTSRSAIREAASLPCREFKKTPLSGYRH